MMTKADQVDPHSNQTWQTSVGQAVRDRNWQHLLGIAQRWTQAQPSSVEAWQSLSRAHFEESRFTEAINAYAQVLRLVPDDPAHRVSAARLAIAAHDYGQARDYLDAAQQMGPASAELLYSLCRLHHLTGDLQLAEDYCRRAIAARPGFATAYVELGALCEGKLSDAEVDVIRQLFDNPAVHPEYRVMLGFTLGDALDRRNEYEQAFAAWIKGNEINRQISEQEGLVYQPALIESELALLPDIFNDLVATPDTWSADHPCPVFIVGMPRSGTTLVESILASHPDVHGAGELPTLYDIHETLMAVARQQGIEAARNLVRHQAGAWRARYLAALPTTAGKTHIVDKQPLNFRSIGLIRLLFPDSPIIYTRREPLDVGFSIYRHKFAKDWPCAHRLADIGHYYRHHVHIVEMWQARHASAIHVVDHAALVDDPQCRIRELLDAAGLDFQPACLTPHKTRRPVATFSAVQVQRPISIRFSGRSHNYARQLVPLSNALRQTTEVITSCAAQPENRH